MGQGIMTNYGQRSESFWIRESLEYIIDAGQGGLGRNIVRNHSRLDHFNQFNCIDCFVISHGDSDHISLAREIVMSLHPQVIVISPLVYAINKYRYTVQNILGSPYPNPNYLPDWFFEQNNDTYYIKNDYSLENPDDRFETNAPAVYICHRNYRNNATLPWDLCISETSVPEFETYPTKRSMEYAKFVDDFVNLLREGNLTEINDIIRSSEFLSDVSEGIIIDRNYTPVQYMQLFVSIERNILKRVKNDMSLICRVGKTIFTGDANKEQLDEVTEILTQRARELNHDLTIKLIIMVAPQMLIKT